MTLESIYRINGFPPKVYIVTSGKEICRIFDDYMSARNFALTMCFGGTMIMPNGDTLTIPKTVKSDHAVL